MTTDDAQLPAGGGPLAYVEDLDRPELDPDDDHHLRRVRRVRDGDSLVIGDGAGRWRHATLRSSGVEADGPTRHLDRPSPALTVAFALVKGAKPELVVRKLTELGVDRIVPFAAARSVVRWDEAKSDAAALRLGRVAREAAMQSRQPWLPTVSVPTTFAAVASQPGAALAERGGSPLSLDTPMVLIGPEGGWEAAELADRPRVALAPGVLRAETAAIVAGSLLVALRAGVVSRV